MVRVSQLVLKPFSLPIRVPEVVKAKTLLPEIFTDAMPPPMVSQLVPRPPCLAKNVPSVDTAATLLVAAAGAGVDKSLKWMK